MIVLGRTDTGRVRATNQDAFLCGRLSDEVLYAIVCDGMGGAKGGNVASAIAVKVMAERITEGFRENMTAQSMRYMLESAVAAANVEVFDTAMAEEQLRGMGTTVVAALVCRQEAVIAHVGDSRAYLVTPEEMRQVTTDHSVVQAMVEKGQLTESEARVHPRKHFITRALGVENNVECDVNEVTIPEGGQLLICTDGLTNMVEAEEIRRMIGASAAEDAADKLIGAANMAGGSDNITVVLFA